MTPVPGPITPSTVWLNITSSTGELIECIELSDYDLDQPAAQAALIDAIRQAAKVAHSRP